MSIFYNKIDRLFCNESFVHTIMNTPFSIDILNRRTDRMFGMLVITPNVAMTRETLSLLMSILQTRLHYILTHSLQEGESDEESFCSVGHQHILIVKEEVSNFFGEEATVALDANLDHYGPECLHGVYQSGLELLLGACVPAPNNILPGQGDVWGWEFYPLVQDGLDRVEVALRLSHIMT